MSFLVRWRRPLLLSLVIHGLLGAGFWVAGQRPLRFEPPGVDNRIDGPPGAGLVMDIDVAFVAPTPVVEPPPRIVQTAPTTPTAPAPAAVPAAPSPAGEPGPAAPATASRQGTETGSGSGTATTSFFAVPTQARSVVYVIDRSGSMGEHGRLTLARQELLASLAQLPATARFQVIAYNRRAEPLRIGGQCDLLPATVANKEETARLLAALLPEGNTEHVEALKQALRLAPEAVYFLTDADDLRPEQVRALTQINHGQAAIHAIELTVQNRDRHDMPLHELARANRGKYRAVDVR